VFCQNAMECPGDTICCFDPSQSRATCRNGCPGDGVQFCDPAATYDECPSGSDCTGTFTPGTTQYRTCQ
jgi:hypothetical protein